MLALTEQVILTALGDWEIFDEHGVPMKLAVNVPVSALRQPADRAHAARGAAARGALARPGAGSDRGPDHQRSQRSPTTSPTRCARSTARSRSTISAPAIPRWRGCGNCRSASSRSTAAM